MLTREWKADKTRALPPSMEAIEGLRPLATETVMASFRVNMDQAAEEAFGKILQRIAKEDLQLGTDSKPERPPKEKKSSGRRSRHR